MTREQKIDAAVRAVVARHYMHYMAHCAGSWTLEGHPLRQFSQTVEDIRQEYRRLWL